MAKNTRKVSELKIIGRAFCARQPDRSCTASPELHALAERLVGRRETLAWAVS